MDQNYLFIYQHTFQFIAEQILIFFSFLPKFYESLVVEDRGFILLHGIRVIRFRIDLGLFILIFLKNFHVSSREIKMFTILKALKAPSRS